MKRERLNDLILWKKDQNRKPLILRGARQTGKTWLLKEFGRNHFSQVVYVNFEENTDLKSIFKHDFDITRIITTLKIYSRTVIVPEETLIIFDEIQSAENGVTSLKYFYENAPQYYLVAAGSLLGMGLNSETSFPVGKVDFMDLRPMTYSEFLMALNEDHLAESIRKNDWVVLSPFHSKLIEYLKYYLYVGGMPEAVKVFSEMRDWEQVRKVHIQILNSYEADFAKHTPREVVPRIRMVWNSMPAQLTKENKKFVFGVIREGTRAKDYEIAIQWLVDCGLVLKIHRVSKPGMPLIAYQDMSVFKLFLLDSGLLGAMSGINIDVLLRDNEVFTEFKGALTEQYVMQELRIDSNRYIGYWTNERSTSEVDFIVQDKGEIVPFEVKSGENLRAKSFRLFCEKYSPARAFRTALTPYRKEKWMINIPLYGVGSSLDIG